jgi:hypothetical protein
MPDIDAIWQVGAEVLAWAIVFLSWFVATVIVLLCMACVRVLIRLFWAYWQRHQARMERR